MHTIGFIRVSKNNILPVSLTNNIIIMGLYYMPRKAALIMLLVLGVICLVGGIVQKNTGAFVTGLGILGYSIISLVLDWKKKQRSKKEEVIK